MDQAAQFIELNKTGSFRYLRESFATAGQNSFDCPPGQNPDLFEQLWNVMPPVTGSLRRRWGYRTFGQAADVKHLYEYQNDANLQRRIVACSDDGVVALDEAGTTVNPAVYAPAGAVAPRMVASRDFGYFSNPTEVKKWDGDTTVTNWGTLGPTTAISVGTPSGSGNVTLSLGGRCYYLVFKTKSGHYSDLSPISAVSGNCTGSSIPLNNLAVSADSQVDRKTILATGDGADPSILYELVELPNDSLGYTDNLEEETLLTRNIFLETDELGNERGVADNTPPLPGAFPLKHKGRLFMLDGQFLRCSKSLAELTTSTGNVCGKYEEAWPADYELDISEGAETARGMLSDGEVLYIGTERHIRRLYGSGPDDFQQPEVAFNEVGIVNQDVWRIVFLEGTPAGAMWLTPDRRVIASDFNTYVDVGTPIQDLLEDINPAAIGASHAVYFSAGRYALYMLFIATGTNTVPDTICVYSLSDKRWYVWKFADAIATSLFNVTASGATQLLIADSDGQLFVLDSTLRTDAGQAIPVTARTVWLQFGDASRRKLLNEIEVLTEDFSAMRITVEGATTTLEFDSPKVVKTNGVLQQNALGTWKLFLATCPALSRYYRLTFSSTSAIDTFLDSYNLEGVLTNRI